MKVVGFGDYLMHFSPIEKMRFRQADMMQLTYTGAEANVCMALGFWGEDVEFVTSVPGHALSEKGIAFLKSNSVATDHIVYGNGRMGVYFLESGYSLRPSQVIYDREKSVFTSSCFEDYDWDSILSDAGCFYLSGITPSLSDTLLACCVEVLKECKKRNIPVFFDVNLRPTLCSIEKSKEIFALLSPYITHLISNEEHLKQLLGYNDTEESSDRLLLLTKKAEEITGIGHIAITVRRTPSASKAIFYASYYNGADFHVAQTREIDVVDRVGSGDAFSAGILYSELKGFEACRAVEFAVASSALKHTINSDINFTTVPEILDLIDRAGGDVKR